MNVSVVIKHKTGSGIKKKTYTVLIKLGNDETIIWFSKNGVSKFNRYFERNPDEL